jgi:hypothetical protein
MGICQKLREMISMAQNITDLLLEKFSLEQSYSLSYEEFISPSDMQLYVRSIYDDEPGLTKTAFDLIAHPWPEIYWPTIAGLGIGGWMITSFLNKKSFIYVFPSLLKFIHVFRALPKDENTGPASLMLDSFIENCLNLRNVCEDWKLEFYFSFDDDTIKLVAAILKEQNSPLAEDAIESYWH